MTKYYTYCADCGKKIDLQYYSDNTCLCLSCQEKRKQARMAWKEYTDCFGNRMRVSQRTGGFEIKTWRGWTGAGINGKVEFRYIDGDLYIGEAKGNLRHGKGKLIYSDGSYYEGDFVNSRFEGKGKYVWTDGTVYEGAYVNNSRTGKGKETWKNGTYYEGDFVDGKIEGYGKRLYSDGTIYVGQFRNAYRHGKGKEMWTNGTYYEGDYVDGKIEGYGKRLYADGTVYVGQFRNAYCHGKGKETWKDGTYYEGDFVDGKIEGYGKRLYADGGVYEGQFSDGNRHGKGKYTWTNGNTYEGDFVNNVRTGKGKYVWASGTVYTGDFVNGKYDGIGKCCYYDGYVYEGEFRQHNRHGKGLFTAPDGTAIEYYFEDNKRLCPVDQATEEIVKRIYGSERRPAPVYSQPTEVKPAVEQEARVDDTPKTAVVSKEAVKEAVKVDADLQIWEEFLALKSAQRDKFLATHPVMVVPQGVKKIASNTFRNCKNLKGVKIGADVVEICSWAFEGCSNLGPVLTIPQGVKKIASGAFENCTSIKKLVLPDNVTLERKAFTCGLEEVQFQSNPPRNVSLTSSCFYGCDKTMSREMRKQIKEVGKHAFG